MSAIPSSTPQSSAPNIVSSQLGPAVPSPTPEEAKGPKFLCWESLPDFLQKLPTELGFMIFAEVFSHLPLYTVAEITEVGEPLEGRNGVLWPDGWFPLRKEFHWLFPQWFSTDRELKAFIKDARTYGGKTFEQIFEGLTLLKDQGASGNLENYTRAGIIEELPPSDPQLTPAIAYLDLDIWLRNRLLKWLQENPARTLACLRWFPKQTRVTAFYEEACIYKSLVLQRKYPVRVLADIRWLLPTFIPDLLKWAAKYKSLYTFKKIFESALLLPTSINDEANEMEPPLSTPINTQKNEEVPFYKIALEQAIENADIDIVKYILDQLGEKILSVDILDQVVQTACLDMVQLFIEKHVKLLDPLNAKKEMASALELAVCAISGRYFLHSKQLYLKDVDHYRKDGYQRDINLLNIAGYLIQQGRERGFNFHINFELSDTTLLHAVCYAPLSQETEELALFLVRQDADLVDALDKEGNTPLQLAVQEKLYERMQFLVNHHAKVDTVLELANKLDDLDALEILLKNPSNYKKALEQLVKYPSLDKARMLVEKNIIKFDQVSAGNKAAEAVACAISGFWFSPSRRSNAEDRYQRDIDLFKVACYLIEEGRKNGVKFDIGYKPINTTLLHAACYAKPFQEVQRVVTFLVNQYPNIVHDVDSDGNTLLHVAMEEKNYEMLQFLVSHNAKVDTALELANKLDDLNALEILLKNPSARRKALEQLIKYPSIDKARMLVEKNIIKLDQVNTEKKAAEAVGCAISGFWFSPSRRSNAEDRYQRDMDLFKVACYLIEEGCKNGVKFDMGYKPTYTTLLHAACYAKLFQEVKPVVIFLVNQYPNLVHDVDSDGSTPLHVAVEEKNYEMMQFLRDHNAKVDVKQNFRPTVMDLATVIGDLKTLEILQTQPSKALAPAPPPTILAPISNSDTVNSTLIENKKTQDKSAQASSFVQVMHHMYTYLLAILTFIPVSLYEMCRNWLLFMIAYFQ